MISHLRLEGQHLCLLPDETDVGDGQTVEKVHQDHHDEEDEGHEEDFADRVLGERDVRELELSHKHGGGLQKTRPDFVKERVVVVLGPVLVVSVEHHVEAEGKGDDEEAVPEEELKEGDEDRVEHGELGAETWVLANLGRASPISSIVQSKNASTFYTYQDQSLSPRQGENQGSKMPSLLPTSLDKKQTIIKLNGTKRWIYFEQDWQK